MNMFSEVARFVDPVSFLIVFGGAVLAAAARSSREEIARAVRALAPLFRDRPEADALAARRAVNAVEAIAQIRSIACADRVRTAGVFLRRAAFRLSDAASTREFALWAEEELAARARRHAGVIAAWRALADAAPAMGMIGTVIGLVRMFSVMDDGSAIGPAMALAMLTTLYGILLSGVIAGPIAARLERLSEAELDWQRWTLARFEALIKAELDTASFRARPALRTVS